MGHRDADAAEELDPFGKRIDNCGLFVRMLVEQQMQLIEGRSGHLPVMLLYKSRSVIVSASTWFRFSTDCRAAVSESAIGMRTRWPNGWISCAC